MRNFSITPALSPSFDETKRFPKPKSKVSSSRPKPKLQKHSTAPCFIVTKETNVVDDVLMDRAFIIRQNLMNFEMQELAVEAEKAAESGFEKFVGSTSKFGVEETPPYRPKFADDGEFVMSSSRSSEGFRTPLRQRKSFVDTLTYPMEYTPSYFARKKIPVTSLRNFSEIIPNFSEMHNNIRAHLGREGVDLDMLPELHSRRSLIKNDTDDTEKEDGEDATSQAPSIAASHTGSMSSFSSYAVASMTSLKEIIEHVHRPTDNTIRMASSMSNVSQKKSVQKDFEQSGFLRSKSCDNGCFPADRMRGINASLPNTSTHFEPVVASANSDSDDSSIEFYGRKSPIDFSSQSASSNASEINQLKSSLLQSRSNVSSGDKNQPVFQRRRRNTTGACVSFDTEKANYQPLLDRMHDPVSIASFDVDQSSCVPSLNIDILPSSPTSTKTSTPMANFLNKIQNQFSRTSDGTHKSSEAFDEGNKLFVSNFFYTSQDPGIVDPHGFPTLKLDINPERHRDPYCLPGCGQNDLISACEIATKYADFVFDWFSVGGGPQAKESSAIIDPNNAAEQPLNPNWIRTWQANESEDGNDRQRIFTPPKLSVRHAVQHDEETFCSPESATLESECDGTMACPEVREPILCVEIQNNIGCSPE
eukprot:CAMPEP_0172326774 /NCGR_PEP_ID=MMETSP1058-20130122/57519_1 /TAXON_ID=83371 /ORGANISM="Detonula confervacea, Strain CCMP 353" /LENGTH=646 /DNA_ID=CAMNT_0013043641 /DNA_START=303 /DNA_END=2243 /DNA_ORIENTATION=+